MTPINRTAELDTSLKQGKKGLSTSTSDSITGVARMTSTEE